MRLTACLGVLLMVAACSIVGHHRGTGFLRQLGRYAGPGGQIRPSTSLEQDCHREVTTVHQEVESVMAH